VTSLSQASVNTSGLTSEVSSLGLLRPKIYFGSDLSIGPGKIDLLIQVRERRSISAAAKALNMPYKKAWLLIDSLNTGIGKPVVVTSTGGRGGGGAELTVLGEKLIDRYVALEQCINDTVGDEIKALRRLLR
jgi:molybdate transport system regulatory protein